MTLAAPAAAGSLVLGRYRLLAPLGRGGFGTVWRARDEELQREVAVKIVAGDGAAPQRARREALAAARLRHPAVVALFDAGEEPGHRVLVSELVEGATLAELERAGALSDRDVVRIGIALCAALRHAHHHGIVHRDVKPQNVMVCDPAHDPPAPAKLCDFGVATLAGDGDLTATGDVVGTLAYMAPEQAAGEPVDDRADLYALALTLYEAFSGVNPVRGAGPAATARRLGTRLPSLATARGDLPPALLAVIDRALEPHPDRRGELADLEAALHAALDAVGDEHAAHLPEPVAPLPAERRRARRRARAVAARTVLALAAGTAALVSAGHHAGGPVLPAGSAPAAGLAVAVAVLIVPRVAWGLACALAAGLALAAEAPREAAWALAAAALCPPRWPVRGGLAGAAGYAATRDPAVAAAAAAAAALAAPAYRALWRPRGGYPRPETT